MHRRTREGGKRVDADVKMNGYIDINERRESAQLYLLIV